jgi:hypothetical protein
MKTILAVLILGTSLSLAAQEVRFGVQGALSLPANDLSDNADAGLQLGGHARWDLSQGSGLMARVDATFYGENAGVTVDDLALAVDYTYHFQRRQRGLYVLAGLSEQNYHTSFNGYSQNNDGLGFDFGAGYDLDRHVGLQARYTTNSFDYGTYSALNLGVTYTFSQNVILQPCSGQAPGTRLKAIERGAPG